MHNILTFELSPRKERLPERDICATEVAAQATSGRVRCWRSAAELTSWNQTFQFNLASFRRHNQSKLASGRNWCKHTCCYSALHLNDVARQSKGLPTNNNTTKQNFHFSLPVARCLCKFTRTGARATQVGGHLMMPKTAWLGRNALLMLPLCRSRWPELHLADR